MSTIVFCITVPSALQRRCAKRDTSASPQFSSSFLHDRLELQCPGIALIGETKHVFRLLPCGSMELGLAFTCVYVCAVRSTYIQACSRQEYFSMHRMGYAASGKVSSRDFMGHGRAESREILTLDTNRSRHAAAEPVPDAAQSPFAQIILIRWRKRLPNTLSIIVMCLRSPGNTHTRTD
jgi:hypothetical protein